MQKLVKFLLRPDWCYDEEGDVTFRIWGRVGFTFYKWPDCTIVCNAKNYKRVNKRGIILAEGHEPY